MEGGDTPEGKAASVVEGGPGGLGLPQVSV